MNSRIQKLRDELLSAKPVVDGQRCRIFTESMKKSDGLPIILRRAQSFYEVLDQMTVWVKPGELIVGNQSRFPKGSPVYPEYSTQWILDELDGKPEINSIFQKRMRKPCGKRQSTGMGKRYMTM